MANPERDDEQTQGQAATSVQSIDHYDRMYGRWKHFMGSKPSIITDAGDMFGLGGVRRYVVQTFRDPDGNECSFVEMFGPEGLKRVVLPPAVTSAQQSQHDGLIKRSRKAAAKQGAKTRKARGIKPFAKKAKE